MAAYSSKRVQGVEFRYFRRERFPSMILLMRSSLLSLPRLNDPPGRCDRHIEDVENRNELGGYCRKVELYNDGKKKKSLSAPLGLA